jgi:hypothetical protein
VIVSEIGMIAHRWLAQVREATLLGKSTRGFYLLLPLKWVIFLSFETYRGPLTLNLRGASKGFEALPIGTPIKIEADSLRIPQADLIISYHQAKIWQAKPPTPTPLSASQRLARLRSTAQALFNLRSPSQLSETLPLWLNLPQSMPASGNIFLPLLKRLNAELITGDALAIAAAIQPLLGMGSGLTPSGDDLVLGLLLTLNRWGQALRPELKVDELNRAIRSLQFNHTTTLAANLIECALEGQANERLILALDGILSGEADTTQCARYLASWGNSSGMDAFTGMVLAILSAAAPGESGLPERSPRLPDRA